MKGKITSTSSIILHNAANSFPIPNAAGGGGDISVTRDASKYAPLDWDIRFGADGTTTLIGPVAAYSEDDDGNVAFIGLLNGGADIVIQSAVVGARFQLSTVGIFKRLLIGGYAGAVIPSGGKVVTVVATPYLTIP